MVYKPKKLIMSIFTLGLTIATLTTSTYAWFSKNSETWIDEFSMDIENTENLLISIDGEVFKSSLAEDDIKKAISAKYLNKSIAELTDDEINAYQEINLDAISTTDLINGSFVKLDGITNDGTYYTPVSASNSNYISFDLYFRKDSSQELITTPYELMFVDETYTLSNPSVKSTAFTSSSDTITLNNSLTAWSNGTTKEYNANEDITVNPINAIRIGVIDSNANTSKIFEPYDSLGSYAVSSHTGQNDKYDPSCNAMLTYFNNIYKYQLKPLDEKVNTYSSLGGTSLAEFTINEDNTGYNDVKITIYIWLEGYDADYIPGIDVGNIKSYLSFYITAKDTTKEVGE